MPDRSTNHNAGNIGKVARSAFFMLTTFVLGWILSYCHALRLKREDESFFSSQQSDHIATLRKHIYGTRQFDSQSTLQEIDDQFDQSGGTGAITLSYSGGYHNEIDTHIRVDCNGGVFVIDHGSSRQVHALDRGRCANFFKRVLTGGLLSYSEAAVELKQALTQVPLIGGEFDAPLTELDISVPELGIRKEIAIHSPRTASRIFPDIIEFQLFITLEDEILCFIPKGELFRK